MTAKSLLISTRDMTHFSSWWISMTLGSFWPTEHGSSFLLGLGFHRAPASHFTSSSACSFWESTIMKDIRLAMRQPKTAYGERTRRSTEVPDVWVRLFLCIQFPDENSGVKRWFSTRGISDLGKCDQVQWLSCLCVWDYYTVLCEQDPSSYLCGSCQTQPAWSS